VSGWEALIHLAGALGTVVTVEICLWRRRKNQEKNNRAARAAVTHLKEAVALLQDMNDRCEERRDTWLSQSSLPGSKETG